MNHSNNGMNNSANNVLQHGINQGMDEYGFNNYPDMEYNAPVDVEATLNSLLASSPSESYDFSASLLSNPSSSPSLVSSSSFSSLRTSTTHTNIPLRTQTSPHVTNINTSGNYIINNISVHNGNPNGNIPIISPSAFSPATTAPPQPFPDPAANSTPQTANTTQVDKRKRRRKDDILITL